MVRNRVELIAQASQLAQSGRREEAARLYRRVLATNPDHPDAIHFLGACLVQMGKTAEGFALIARSLQLEPRRVTYRQNFALLLAETGNLSAAESELLQAIALQPGDAVSHNYLGTVRQRQRRFPEAIDAYRAALEHAPDDSFIANNYGCCLFESGAVDTAIPWLQASIAKNPRNAVAHINMGNALGAKGNVEDAVASYRLATEIDPLYTAAWYNLGIGLRSLGDRAGSYQALRSAVRTGPDTAIAWHAFGQSFESLRFERWDPQAAAELTAVLRHPAVDGVASAEAAAGLLAHEPSNARAIQAMQAGGHVANTWFGRQKLSALAPPLLMALIENFLIPTPDLESFLRMLRLRAVEGWHSGTLKPSPQLLELACALAHQCFLNEYVWPVVDAEQRAFESLLIRCRAGASALELALLATLHPLAAIERLIRPNSRDAAFAVLWRRAVEEPAEERRIEAEIGRLTPIEDDVSLAVQRQYEENPYPRWHRAPASLGSFPLAALLRTLFPWLDPARLSTPIDPDILIAGCGSGSHAAVTAARNPSSRVLAIDLSRKSLAYAIRRCRELGLKNLRFAQADILQLDALPERFDLIECAGVLHHLRDPMAGWKILKSLLRPGGVMKIALYSETARRSVVAARELVAQHRFAPDLEGIRAARQLMLALPENHPAHGVTRMADFFAASSARDLFMHVQEHRFTTDALRRCITSLGLEFLGFEPDMPGALAAYRARFPEDEAATSIENWGRFEAENPQVFSAMYQFWVYKPQC